ncbi:MAG TPA: HAMP domain-containing sensor histidine kinase [Miltoncostaeaceae bacterium]|nr:HAMP domain-containing sensor histidine kinase [Miltoncostaeaceae bacterium]
MKIRRPDLSLRTQLSAALVAVAILTAALAAALTTWGLHASFDEYLRERAAEAGQQAVRVAEEAYGRSGGRWTAEGLDLLAHDLAASGYDYRVTDTAGRVLLDTTKSAPGRTSALLFRGEFRDPEGRVAGRLEAFSLSSGGRTDVDVRFARELDRLHVVAAFVAGVLAILLGVAIAARLARPLRALADAAPALARAGAPPRVAAAGPPEVRRLGDSFATLAAHLDRQRRARLQLAQDLAHELRTPLMLMQSRLEAMEDGIVATDAGALAALHATTLRLARLVDQIEALAESEADPPQLVREPLRLDTVAARTAEALTASFADRGLRVILDLAPAEATGDEDATEQIVTNLLTNAAKYAPEFSDVRLATRVDGAWAELRVVDAGGSLAEAGAERVFERFYRGPGGRGTGEGVGLGLTIARALAGAMGGDLDLDATATSTAFVLRLPAPAAPPGPRTRRPRPRPETRTTRAPPIRHR